jgi:hypothetical protein
MESFLKQQTFLCSPVNYFASAAFQVGIRKARIDPIKLFVDPLRIELRSHPCEGCVLPLNYEPVFTGFVSISCNLSDTTRHHRLILTKYLPLAIATPQHMANKFCAKTQGVTKQTLELSLLKDG